MSRQVSPIASYIRKHNHLILLIGILVVATFFRFYQITQLPPGLHPDEANIGLKALALLRGDVSAALSMGGVYSILFIALQSLFVKTLGTTLIALHIVPALLGVASVGTTYLWMRTWFGKRAGLIAAMLLAVSPWAVTLSRSSFWVAPLPLLITLLLWLYTRGLQTKKAKWFVFSGIVMGLGFYTHPAFISFCLGLALIGLIVFIFRRKFFRDAAPRVATSFIIALCIVLPGIVYTATHSASLKEKVGTRSELVDASGKPLERILKSTVASALIFNVHGDESYVYNYASQPGLNVFVGIMFVLGILLCLSALARPRYFAMLALLLAGLGPVLLRSSGTPSFAWAAGALPIAIGLATIGIGYMLDRWYATFPINSAARGSGLGIIVVLLLLTCLQGYTQYFISWANDSKTYFAYHEEATNIGKYLLNKPFNGKRYLLLDAQSNSIPEYLTSGHGTSAYTRINPSDINSLPLDGKPKQFLISSDFKNEAIRSFKLKFPGGRLSPYDGFDQTELFLVYEVSK